MGLVLTDALILVNGVKIDSYANRVGVEMSAEFDDGTTFGKTTKVKNPGARDSKISAGGYMDYDTTPNYSQPEKNLWALIGTANNIITVSAAKPSTIGDRFITLKGTLSNWKILGEHGKTSPWELAAEGSRYIIRGPTLRYTIAGNGSGNGTAYQYVALPAASELLGVLHAWDWSCTSLLVKFQSSPNGTDTWSDRLTMTTLTAAGAEIKSYLTATTDTYWRVNFAITGTSCSYLAGIWIGSRTRGGESE
jgi:hypothetical protein